ncbi:UPF0598 protein CG30010 [Aricia agestis]|uniref:UPF0598 protein CG30010 n=1 Tax=Aricia agestis TaxID=91739 RepID=UPI001C202BED|nr:UPF0598 protein CG30010 [Aricia agestis]
MRLLRSFEILRLNLDATKLCRRYVTYIQGQEPEPRVREYFYYIDHQGMLFLDDSKMKNFTSCFKEKKFLEFFFKRIRLNKTDRYKEFPFISLCGRERNYIKCDDVPIVYTHIVTKEDNLDYLLFGYAGDLLKTEFKPEKVYMLPETGRVYHPADNKYGGVGLIRSKLAIELSKHFTFKNGEEHPPTHLEWKNNNYELDQEWFKMTVQEYGLSIKKEPD